VLLIESKTNSREQGANMAKEFPKQQPGVNYLTEGGQETEIMYKYGYDLPHFESVRDVRAARDVRTVP
jgi:hypothetical protein